MTYGRTKLALVSEKIPPAAPAMRALAQQREVDHLRAINAHLQEEIAALKEREVETQRLADRDGLTGLYNRRCLQALLETTIAEAKFEHQSVGVLFLDLNGFKGINDEYGHAAGDKILITVATRINARVRIGDLVCRYGGDEFVVILPNVPDPLAVSKVADGIRERISLPYWVNNHEQHITAAIGESLYPFDGDTAASVLQRADQAMYRLKSHMATPSVTLGWAPPPRMSRRRGDKSKPRLNEVR